MRDAVIIGITVLLAILLGLWLFLEEAPKVKAPEGQATFSVLIEGQFSGSITERKNYRVQSEEGLRELWRLVYGNDGPIVPDIDFDTYELLAVFDGTHSSGGYDITVESVMDTPAVRTVSILHTVPGEECLTSQAITSPFEIVLLPKSSATISRTDRIETISCE